MEGVFQAGVPTVLPCFFSGARLAFGFGSRVGLAAGRWAPGRDRVHDVRDGSLQMSHVSPDITLVTTIALIEAGPSGRSRTTVPLEEGSARMSRAPPSRPSGMVVSGQPAASLAGWGRSPPAVGRRCGHRGRGIERGAAAGCDGRDASSW
jgi:hypothetical protein